MHGHPANALNALVLENQVFAGRHVRIFTDGQDTVEKNARQYNALMLNAKTFSDPGAHASLCRHDGAHPEIISRLLNHMEFKGWILRALVQLRDWAEARLADQLRVIVFCRAGKHRSRACGWVLLHCLQRFGASVTLQHLSGKMCWESQKGMLCRHCSHVGNKDRNEVLNRTFDIICKKPYKFPYKVQPTPKSRAMPKKRTADMAMVSTSNESLLRSSCSRLATGHLKACANVTADAVEKAVNTYATTESAKTRAAITAAMATAQVAAAANAQAATESPITEGKPLHMAKAEATTLPSFGPRPPFGPPPSTSVAASTANKAAKAAANEAERTQRTAAGEAKRKSRMQLAARSTRPKGSRGFRPSPPLAAWALKKAAEATVSEAQMKQKAPLVRGSELLALRKVLHYYIGLCGTDADMWDMRWIALELEFHMSETDLKRAIKNLVGHGNGNPQDQDLPCFLSSKDEV